MQILVENQGRINYNIPNDFKGILGDVTIDGATIYNWTMTGIPLDKYEKIQNLIDIQLIRNNEEIELENKLLLKSGPVIYYGVFEINSTQPIYDTYLDPTGWGKV